MARYALATARDQLDALLDRALAGETVIVERNDHQAFEIRLAEQDTLPTTRAGWLDWLEARRIAIEPGFDGAALVRRMRDEEPE